VSEQFDQEFWDSRYEQRPTLWSGDPNHRLVVEVEGLPPGTALDVGAGEGADAIWLATRGWRVTAVDISGVALTRAAGHAARVGPGVAGRIDWLRRDLTDWKPPEGFYDLVSAHFFHLSAEPRRVLFARLVSAVTAGGTLLLVGHRRIEGSIMPDEYFFTGDEIVGQLDPEQWDVIINAEVERPPTDAGAGAAHTHDMVFRATRRRHRGQNVQ
jgi:SAM-dependent methyltransferase